jgi:hypothetical protein
MIPILVFLVFKKQCMLYDTKSFLKAYYSRLVHYKYGAVKEKISSCKNKTTALSLLKKIRQEKYHSFQAACPENLIQKPQIYVEERNKSTFYVFRPIKH